MTIQLILQLQILVGRIFPKPWCSLPFCICVICNNNPNIDRWCGSFRLLGWFSWWKIKSSKCRTGCGFFQTSCKGCRKVRIIPLHDCCCLFPLSLIFAFCYRATKTHPGPVVHLSDSPKDEGKVGRQINKTPATTPGSPQALTLPQSREVLLFFSASS